MKRDLGRSGFTLVELLVVIFLIGLVMMLLIPQRRGAREAARRASCSVKLKNLATALHLYHDNFQQFPPSASYHDGTNVVGVDARLSEIVPGQASQGPARAPYSFTVLLLPYFEQGQIYDAINFKRDEAFAPANHQWANKPIPVLQCPSYRGGQNASAADYSGLSAKPAITNYKALGATTLACLQDSASVTNDKLNGGVLHPHATYTFNTLKAPTQTVVLVETKEEKYAAWWDGTTASIPGFHPGEGNVRDDRRPTPPLGKPALNLDSSGSQTGFISTNQFGGKEDMQWGPSSEHPGLVNHASMGSETRSLNNDVDPEIYRALISRRADDNGVIGDQFK